jgi:acetyl esterase/lipase
MVAIVADYRVYGRHKTSAFEAIADAKSAIRWVRSHAGELKIDANRIAAGGGSSGGHLAAAAAVLDRFDEKNENHAVSSKPNALVLFNPAIDTGPKSATASTTNGGRNLAARLGDRGEEGSPLHHLGRNLPPTLILHGKADASVPYSDVERFCEAATRLGNTCQLVGYEGAGHGFFNNTWREETMLEADRFLVALGYLKNASPAVKDVDPE